MNSLLYCNGNIVNITSKEIENAISAEGHPRASTSKDDPASRGIPKGVFP
jgi:hypothetical protein